MRVSQHTRGFEDEIRPAVWAMVQSTYAKIGLILDHPGELDEYNVWDLFEDADGQFIAFRLGKTTAYGGAFSSSSAAFFFLARPDKFAAGINSMDGSVAVAEMRDISSRPSGSAHSRIRSSASESVASSRYRTLASSANS